MPRPAVVALSGLDGSGKSSQAEALRRALEDSGVRAVVEWTRLGSNPVLDRVAAPVRKLLRAPPRVQVPDGAPRPAELEDDPARRLRRRSRVVNQAWSTIVALANVLEHWRVARRHRGSAQVVVCDRYVLDSLCHLRFKYGGDRRLRLQGLLVRRLSPRPLGAYYLAVPPDLALARKSEQYGLAELRAHAELYEREHEAVGARRLDGRRPGEELSAEIVLDVFGKLGLSRPG